jgi:hypothetical protein
MRIRTIKPEFWRHRQMSKLPPFTRLVAIALLNIADDKGYFQADSDLVRGEVFPFEKDSTSIQRALDELSMLGYCVIAEHSSKGPIGFLPTFDKHQVIDRQSKSKWKEIYEEAVQNTNKNIGESSESPKDSANPRRVIDELSSLEQGNRGTGEVGTGEQGKTNTASAVVSEKEKTKKPSRRRDYVDPLPELYVNGFRRFWEIYPKKVDKENAKRAYVKAVQKIMVEGPDDDGTGCGMLDAQQFLEEWLEERLPGLKASETQYRPHPSSWLNGGRYRDDTAIEAAQVPHTFPLRKDVAR